MIDTGNTIIHWAGWNQPHHETYWAWREGRETLKAKGASEKAALRALERLERLEKAAKRTFREQYT